VIQNADMPRLPPRMTARAGLAQGHRQQEAPRRQLERHFRAFLDLRLVHVEVIGPHLPV
jgi:hypothetical protein